MKKLNISLIFLALILIGALGTKTSFARNASEKNSPDMKQLRKIINNVVISPGFTLNDKEDGREVYVTFILTDDGKIIVEKVTAPSQRLEEYVKVKLSGLIVKDVIHLHNQLYKIKIRFDNS